MSKPSLSPSQLKVFLVCEEKWRLQYVEKLSPKGSNPLFFEKGSYVHELMHYYYSLIKAGFPVGSEILITAVADRIKEDLARELLQENPDMEFYRNVAKTVMQYIKTVSPGYDSHIKDIEHELHLEVDTLNRLFHGYVDLMYWDKSTNERVIRDHKTGAGNTWSNEIVAKDVQLLMYGALWYKMTGEVARVEVSFMHTSMASKPKANTVLYGLFKAQHTESTYHKFWDYLLSVADRMDNLQTLQNFNACGKCPYYRICRAGLRGYSAERIKKANFYGPDSANRKEVQPENTDSGDKVAKAFHVNIGGRNN